MEQKIQIETIKDFANILHLTDEGLEKILNKLRYKKFYIKKRNNTKREINAPSFELRTIQKWVLVNILEKEKISEQSMAFVKNKNGLKESALIHKNSHYTLSMDLKDFYPSISKTMVFTIFKNLGYSINTSKLLTDFCTYQDKLPQGGITSPYISNLACKKIDEEIMKYCSERQIIYSRYADDLTLSSDNKGNLVDAERDIKKILSLKSRFKINEQKTRLLSPISHKKVTGITINNNEIKASKKIKQNVRLILYFVLKNGAFRNDNTFEKLMGSISFVNSIEDDYIEKCIDYVNYLKLKHNVKNDLEILKTLEKIKFKKLNSSN